MTKPFLKWPGGKRWAACQIASILRPYLKGKYLEPFLGGGAVFFELLPPAAMLSDINQELILVYKTTKRSYKKVLGVLQTMPVSREYYYKIRNSRPRSPVELTARFLYLNRTAFGGMYRVNQQGDFNVPYGGGRTPDILWTHGLLKGASEALRGSSALLECCDFEQSMREAGPGDVVYCDPTYTVAHAANGFARYNERNFAWRDQERLAAEAFAAQGNGAMVVVSNAFHQSIADLYAGAELQVLSRRSLVCPDPKMRRQVQEYLIVLRP